MPKRAFILALLEGGLKHSYRDPAYRPKQEEITTDKVKPSGHKNQQCKHRIRAHWIRGIQREVG